MIIMHIKNSRENNFKICVEKSYGELATLIIFFLFLYNLRIKEKTQRTKNTKIIFKKKISIICKYLRSEFCIHWVTGL